LNIITLASLIAVSNFTYAHTHTYTHTKTLYEITKVTAISSKENAHIAVGRYPTGIGVDENLDKVYVANTMMILSL